LDSPELSAAIQRIHAAKDSIAVARRHMSQLGFSSKESGSPIQDIIRANNRLENALQKLLHEKS
jgi:hypothetical protein